MSVPTEENKPAEEVEGQAPGETTEQGTENNEPDDNEQASEEQNEENEDEGDESQSKLSHEDALKALSKTRKSEAKYRTRLRELESKLENAKTPEEVESLLNEVKTENAREARTLLVENVALKHGLPADLAEALKGDTREELEAHAKVLAKYAPAPEVEEEDLSGGLNPSGNDESFDPVKLAREARRRRY